MKRLDNKVAIITGAASGMGAVEARLFADEGAKVLLTDIQEEKLKQIADEITAGGGWAAYLVHDVTSEESWSKTILTAIEKFGKVDILINNAGILGPYVAFEDATLSGFNQLISVNLESQFLGIKTIIPFFRKNGGGSVVNISSTAGIVASAHLNPGYTSSKGGSRLLTKSAAAELAVDNIRVNSVHPGYVYTPMTHFIFNDKEQKDAVVNVIPMKREGQPIEIAQAVLFIASDEASYITGTELIVDGGYTCI
jgi:cyclopentanol dehydrogenase